ncbi:MAG: 5-carboxymethyl-2-hydroxymuconate isomerase [Rhizobacter sp.]|nr:5-carboxymethyl-2-hydroxymuconate isomerase [Rhizobacter sp.]
MPHFTLEYSANLESFDITPLCAELARTLVAQQVDGKPVFPIGGVRVRAYRAEHYCIADGQPDAGFVHGSMKVGAGRSQATLKAAGDAAFEVIEQHFAKRFADAGLALSMEIGEFSEAGTWKHNNLHARFKPGLAGAAGAAEPRVAGAPAAPSAASTSKA